MSLTLNGRPDLHGEDSIIGIRDRDGAGEGLHSIRLPQIGPRGDGKTMTVHLAETDAQRASARQLVNRMYDWRGYGSSHHIPSRPTHMTFTATLDSDVVGTITLGVDSDAGLAADSIFRDEINTFRRVPGARVCELTKLAFDSAAPSKPVLAALFHLVFIYGQRRYHCSDLFIEVNPRHRRFYEAMLGFQRIGELKTNSSVGAPSQLMWLKVSDIRSQIDELAGKGDAASTRSLYPFFFSQREEQGIFARLAAASGTIEAPARGGYEPHPIMTRATGAHADGIAVR